MFPGTYFRRVCLSVGSLIVLALRPSAHGELDWPQRSIELRGDAKSTVLEARFPFTNTGKTAVDVTDVESSCGCTVVSLEKRHYAPDEKGEIVARYTVGATVGDQRKTIEVITSGGREPVTLTLDIHIPEILRIRPASVAWAHGEAPSAKTLIVEVVQDTPFKDVSVQSSAAAFTAEVKTLVAGRKYELRVTPKRTDQRQFSTLTVRGRFGSDQRDFFAFASVRAPAPAD